MNRVSFQNDVYTLPSCWDELTTQQIETLARLVQQGLTVNDLLFRFTLSCMGMSMAYRYRVRVNGNDYFYVRHGIKRVYLISPEQMAVVTETMNWLVSENSIKPTSCKNPYHEFYYKPFRRLFGPADGITSISLNEWIQVEIERSQWNVSNDEHHLNRLLAILWRPTCLQHPDGDKRAPLRQDDISPRAKLLAKVPFYKKQVMLWFYQASIEFIAAKFPDIFTGGTPGNGSVFDGFMDLVNDLAQNDLAKIDKVREAPLYEALYNIQSIMKRNEKQQKSNGTV